jgi:hypothetical protein
VGRVDEKRDGRVNGSVEEDRDKREVTIIYRIEPEDEQAKTIPIQSTWRALCSPLDSKRTITYACEALPRMAPPAEDENERSRQNL